MRKTAAKGTTAKHAGTSKHAATSKHKPARSKARKPRSTTAAVHTVAKHPAHPKPRALSPGAVACCPAEAVAAAARLAGWAVSDQDVLDLYARCADGPSSGFTIAAALTAGIGGKRLEFGMVPLDDAVAGPATQCTGPRARVSGDRLTSLILGVELPGPHAVTVAPDGCWWSWGQLFDPDGWPDLVIEEAWAVTFA